MRKLIVLAFLLILVFSSFFVAGYYVMFDYDFEKTYTSAVCDGNVCQDYLFTCVSGEIVSSTAISGLVVFDENWTDLREDKYKC